MIRVLIFKLFIISISLSGNLLFAQETTEKAEETSAAPAQSTPSQSNQNQSSEMLTLAALGGRLNFATAEDYLPINCANTEHALYDGGSRDRYEVYIPGSENRLPINSRNQAISYYSMNCAKEKNNACMNEFTSYSNALGDYRGACNTVLPANSRNYFTQSPNGIGRGLASFFGGGQDACTSYVDNCNQALENFGNSFLQRNNTQNPFGGGKNSPLQSLAKQCPQYGMEVGDNILETAKDLREDVNEGRDKLSDLHDDFFDAMEDSQETIKDIQKRMREIQKEIAEIQTELKNDINQLKRENREYEFDTKKELRELNNSLLSSNIQNMGFNNQQQQQVQQQQQACRDEARETVNSVMTRYKEAIVNRRPVNQKLSSRLSQMGEANFKTWYGSQRFRLCLSRASYQEALQNLNQATRLNEAQLLQAQIDMKAQIEEKYNEFYARQDESDEEIVNLVEVSQNRIRDLVSEMDQLRGNLAQAGQMASMRQNQLQGQINQEMKDLSIHEQQLSLYTVYSNEVRANPRMTTKIGDRDDLVDAMKERARLDAAQANIQYQCCGRGTVARGLDRDIASNVRPLCGGTGGTSLFDALGIQ